MKISSLSEELTIMRSEVMALQEEVARLKEDGGRKKEIAELDKREALEKSISFLCVLLHFPLPLLQMSNGMSPVT